MRIIYFGGYWTGYGGTEFDIRTMMTQLARRGFKCHHIGYSSVADVDASKRPLEQEGVDVRFFEGVSQNVSARTANSRGAALKELKKVLTSDDILITIYLPEIEAWKIAKEVGAKVIQKYTIVEDGVDPDEWIDLVDLHIFNSDSCRDTWQSRGVNGFNMVINPEIDIVPEFSDYSIDGGGIGLVHPTRHKGLEIFEGLARAFRDEQFITVGGWSVKDSARKRDDGLIDYMGHVKDIGDFYKRLKVLLVPTQADHTETFGRIVLEGMCYGVPVIASDKDGIPEAADGAAILVREYDHLQEWLGYLHIMLQPEELERRHKMSVDRVGRYRLDLLITRWEIAFNVLGGKRIEVINSNGCKKPEESAE